MARLERLTICRRAYRSYNQRTTWVLKQNHNTARDLAGVIAGETAICWVDPAAGLMYRGYDIHGNGREGHFRGGRLSAAQW